MPYPKPDQWSPRPHIPLLEYPSKHYPPIYAYVYQVVSLSPSGLTTKTLYAPLLRLLLYYFITSFCKENVAYPNKHDVKTATVEHNLKS